MKNNVRIQDVAVNQTASAIVSVSGTVKLQFILVRRASGTAVETVTVISNGATLFTLQVDTNYDRLYCFHGLETKSLAITTSAQAYAQVGVSDEAKGVIPDRV